MVPSPRHYPGEKSLQDFGFTQMAPVALGTKKAPCSTYIPLGPCKWEPFPKEHASKGPQLLHSGTTPNAGTAPALKGLYSSWQGVAAPDWLGQLAGSSS